MSTIDLLAIGTGLLTISTILYHRFTSEMKKRKTKRSGYLLHVPKLKKSWHENA